MDTNNTKIMKELIGRKDYIERVLSCNCLESCNFIVASLDGVYTVGDHNRIATVEIERLCPAQFTKKEAYRISKEFNASNGRGKIIWGVFMKSDFYAQKLIEVNNLINLLQPHEANL